MRPGTTTYNSLRGKSVLVTYGPTWVALDDMRVLSNRSSGTLGKMLCRDLVRSGAKVSALEGPVAQPLKAAGVQVKKFTFFDEFAKLFTAELKKRPDVVIHAAAVSDFRPRQKNKGKISSDKPLTLVLVPTPKLISRVKRWTPQSLLVGFKLEATGCQRRLKQAALRSIKENHCDLVVANSLTKGYRGFIVNSQGTLVAQAATRRAMSLKLVTQLKHYFSQEK